MLAQFVVTLLFLGKHCSDKGLMSCADEKQCTLPHYWCDDLVDCRDESDEPSGCGKLTCNVTTFQRSVSFKSSLPLNLCC